MLIQNQNLSASLILKFLKWVKVFFTPLALAFLLYASWNSKEFLFLVFNSAQIFFLLIAVTFNILAHLVAPLSASTLLKSCNSIVPYKLALEIHINRLPARYLPGGIWHTAGRLIDFHAYGVPNIKLTIFVILENIISIAIAFMLGSPSVYFNKPTSQWSTIAIITFFGSFLMIITPITLNLFFSNEHKLQIRHYIESILIYILIWSLFSISFISYIKAFPSISINLPILEISGTYLFSWAIGLVSFFAPQGIGVFEVIAGNMISASTSIGETVVLITSFRLLNIFAELILWLLSKFVWVCRR